MSRQGEIAKDLYTEKFKWALWLIIGTVIVKYGLYMFGDLIEGFDSTELSGFISFTSNPARIFMLIAGLLSTYVFLTFLVQSGITRREYYYGTLMSAIGLSLTIPSIYLVLDAIEWVLYTFTPYNFGYTNLSDSALLEEFVSYCFIILFYFMVGWFITIGFYRYNWISGLLFILIAVISGMVIGAFWGDEIEIFGISINLGSLPILLSSLVTIIATIVLIVINRLLTRDIKIKM
ncbi:hypothetical protein [Alkalibacillus haloalkaliphilus]|uniref:hypothetical protein n=1 Tax=Alkalibacillus haloalkaliphilus TaxID=94136 RepID=UPI00030CC6EB|nr:hypothetical protein [Alkalibacillus haloalkaliphilus]